MTEDKTIPLVPATEDPVIWRKDLRRLCGDVCGETIRVWMKKGVLPKPDHQLSQRTVGWKRSTLVAKGFPV